MTPTVADRLFDAVAGVGVTSVFGLPGVHALGLWDSLSRTDLRYIGFRHEQAAAHAADGYGRATGLPGVVLSSTGPGALNMLSALAEAKVSSSPVLAITSTIPSQYLGKKKGYLHETDDLMPAFATATRYAATVSEAAEFPEKLERALDAAIGPRPGPALLEIPMDVISAECGEVPFTKRSRAMPTDDEVAQAALLLSLAARPVIWAGGGVLRSGASDALTALAELLGAPVVTTFMGKGAVTEDHPLCAGTMVRQPEAIAMIEQADLMLAVGTRFSGMATSNWNLRPPSQLIHIDIDPEEVGRNYPVRLGIVADAGAALGAIADALKARLDGPKDPSPQAAQVRQAALARARHEGPDEMGMLDAIRRAIPPEVVTVHDMTVPSYWAVPFLTNTEPNTFHYPYGYASLGFSFPAAIGVWASNPQRHVVSFNGDGGFQYHLRELATAAQTGAKVIALVFNDSRWGVLEAFAKSRYENDFGMDIAGPDFVALARSYGVPGNRVDDADALADALGEALAVQGPSVIDIPGAWKLPPPATYYR